MDPHSRRQDNDNLPVRPLPMRDIARRPGWPGQISKSPRLPWQDEKKKTRRKSKAHKKAEMVHPSFQPAGPIKLPSDLAWPLVLRFRTLGTCLPSFSWPHPSASDSMALTYQQAKLVKDTVPALREH